MTEDIHPQPPAETAAATDEVTTVSYGDFVKLTIRVGTIILAEVVPEADKLLRLEVDFGDETRQIVSGIRDFVGSHHQNRLQVEAACQPPALPPRE